MGYTLDGTQSAQVVLSWPNTGDEFSGFYAARDALEAAGFSVGEMQRHDPMGLLFGEFRIAKWRNLSTEDRDELHGYLRGDCRSGTMRAHLYTNVPHEAEAAFKALAVDQSAVSKQAPHKGTTE